MLLEEPLDLRHARAAVDPVDEALLLHQHERRHLLDAELLPQPGVLVDVDATNVQAPALLALDVREQALHPSRRPRLLVEEEDELWKRAVAHRTLLPPLPPAKTAGLYTGRAMWEIYRIGLCAGGGVAVGLLVAALASRLGRLSAAMVAIVAAVVAAVVAGLAIDWIGEAIGGAVGGLLGGAAAATVAAGALRRGGTAGGTALLLLLGALGALALAFVPLVGYLEAAALPALAARTRRRAGEKYAGLRSLAK